MGAASSTRGVVLVEPEPWRKKGTEKEESERAASVGSSHFWTVLHVCANSLNLALKPWWCSLLRNESRTMEASTLELRTIESQKAHSQNPRYRKNSFIHKNSNEPPCLPCCSAIALRQFKAACPWLWSVSERNLALSMHWREMERLKLLRVEICPCGWNRDVAVKQEGRSD